MSSFLALLRSTSYYELYDAMVVVSLYSSVATKKDCLVLSCPVLPVRFDSIRFDSIRFKEARDGDHLITPFQCVECHFVNIQGRLPDSQLQCDHSFGGDSHHPCDSILDSLWSTE